MMRTKATYTLVALAAVAAANPLPKHGSTSVAALEGNATCELLTFTDEPQCALAIGMGPNDVEESGGLERRVNMRDTLHRFKERLNKIKKSCAQAFLNKCSHNTPAPHQNSDDNQPEQNRRTPLLIPFHGRTLYYYPDPSRPVPGTSIMIGESPSMFEISFENDLSRKDKWVEEIRSMCSTSYWPKTGYNAFSFAEDKTKAFFICITSDCDFHLVAHILINTEDLSIKQEKDLSWLFIPKPSPTNLKVDSAPNGDGIRGNEGASDNKGAPHNEGAPFNESGQDNVGVEKSHVR